VEFVERELHLFGVAVQHVADHVLERVGDVVGDDELDADDDDAGDDVEYDEHDEYDEGDERDEHDERDECVDADVVGDYGDDDGDDVDGFECGVVASCGGCVVRCEFDFGGVAVGEGLPILFAAGSEYEQRVGDSAVIV